MTKSTQSTAAAGPTSISLKLLIDAPGKRVVHAEAEKDFVDFLLRVLSLPVANAVGLLGKDAAAFGSVASLHGSVKRLESHILPSKANNSLLKPADNLSFLAPPPEDPGNKFYCSACGDSTDFYSSSSDDERRSRKRRRKALAAGGDEGVVKGLGRYLVTDDLRVMPLTTKTSIDVMKKLGVERLDALEERAVQLTKAEADEFLKVCLQSKSVFTDFFVKGTNTYKEWRPISKGSNYKRIHAQGLYTSPLYMRRACIGF